jgi:bifunctional non-homologous end joining protein LigD
LIKGNDEFESEEDLTITRPESILTGRTNQDLENDKQHRRKTKNINSKNGNNKNDSKDRPPTAVDDLGAGEEDGSEEFPVKIKPMLATAVKESFNDKDWVFEVKWDGVRSIFFLHKTKGIFEIKSRNDKTITHRYPELVGPLNSAIKCQESIILDGEIVVLDKNGLPSFQNHQKRMNVDSKADIEMLSQEIPATYYIFDILHLDGKNLENLDFLHRRNIISQVVVNKSKRVQISDFFEEIGKEVFNNVKAMNLEGVVAKNKSSRYLQGNRSGDWLKIKAVRTQDCVVIGYTRGEGNRENYFGSLLLAVYYSKKLRFVGHIGSGFDFGQLDEIYSRIQKMKIEKCPIDYILIETLFGLNQNL